MQLRGFFSKYICALKLNPSWSNIRPPADEGNQEQCLQRRWFAFLLCVTNFLLLFNVLLLEQFKWIINLEMYTCTANILKHTFNIPREKCSNH